MERLGKNDVNKLRDIKCFLLDMDGTIYIDTTLFDGSMDFINTVKANGDRVFYITNNSSRGTDEYVAKMAKIGVPTTPDEFCTSAHALSFNLNKIKPNAKLFVIGTESLKKYLRQENFTIVEEYIPAHAPNASERPDFVILGFDHESTYKRLKDGCNYILDGVTYWATHPDMVCPAVPHPIPDAGAFMLLIEGVTGKMPEFVCGKPNPCMIEMVMEKYGYKASEVAVMGDRLHTDIMSAKNAGVTAICVLTGEATLEEALAKGLDEQPEYVFDSIKDVYEIIKGKK